MRDAHGLDAHSLEPHSLEPHSLEPHSLDAHRLDPHRLGASLYVPATHPKLDSVFTGDTYPDVRSLIACTEDAIAQHQLDAALARLKEVLPMLPRRDRGPLRFIRPRNVEVFKAILALAGIERVHGFVLPKIDHSTFAGYLKALGDRNFAIMPTLETAAAFEPDAMRALRKLLLLPAHKARCLALRIGGNDLLALLGIRRARNTSIYQTPIGALIPQLVMCFRPHGFQLTGPVFDGLESADTLRAEAMQDRHMGLVGKTAIHPSQTSIIEAVFRVSECELAAANALLNSDAPVMKFDGSMLERTVHSEWARTILRRSHDRNRHVLEFPGSFELPGA